MLVDAEVVSSAAARMTVGSVVAIGNLVAMGLNYSTLDEQEW